MCAKSEMMYAMFNSGMQECINEDECIELDVSVVDFELDWRSQFAVQIVDEADTGMLECSFERVTLLDTDDSCVYTASVRAVRALWSYLHLGRILP